uniref:NADP-dependent oxidoreductase domain-containing protein n=1 Tax=Lutzomyia longipalpis TaxID=7200 RepID=A0A1B0CH08_LUTLO
MSQLPATFVQGFHDEVSVRKMEYQALGRTGLSVSKISLGTGTLSPFYGSITEEGACETVREALRRGINYIDTAYYYGQGCSEKFLGVALKTIPRKAFYIGTKIGRYEMDVANQFDFSAETTRRSVERSLKNLQLDYIDVIQIHDVEFAPNLDIVLKEALPTLEALRDEGKVGYIGVTGYPLNVLKQAIVGAPGRFDTVLAYTRYSMIDDSLTRYLDFFLKENLGVICASGHGLGLLSQNGPQSWHPAGEEIKTACREAAELCRKEGLELGRLAMGYFIQLAGPATFLVGMQSLELLNMNLDVYFNGLTDKEKALIDRIKREIFSKLKQTHWEGVEVARYWSEMEKIGKKRE